MILYFETKDSEDKVSSTKLVYLDNNISEIEFTFNESESSIEILYINSEKTYLPITEGVTISLYDSGKLVFKGSDPRLIEAELVRLFTIGTGDQ